MSDKKILLVTFSDNSDHQDITFGMYEELYPKFDAWLMCIKTPKVSLKKSKHTLLVDCPQRPGICKKTFDIVTLLSVLNWVRKQRFEAIFFETLHVWNLPIMLLKNKKTKVIQMIHDLIPHEGDKQARLVHIMNKVVCKIADKIILANKKYLSKVTELYGIPQSRVAYVDMWRRFPEPTTPKHTKRVLFFGRINPYKGVDNLLEIVRLCPEIQFDVIGRIDPQMEELVTDLRNEPNVTMNNGYVTDEEMAEAFTNCDWVILPYNSATQSGVVIDAYRYSRPAIVFNVGAVSEQVADGTSGYLITAGDNKAFASKLKDAVLMNQDEYNALCKTAYDFGSNKYAAPGAVDRFLALITDA